MPRYRIMNPNPNTRKGWQKTERETYGTRPACSWRRRNSERSLSSWICLRSSSNFFCSASCFCSAFHTFSMFRRLPVCHPFLFRNFNAIAFQFRLQIYQRFRSAESAAFVFAVYPFSYVTETRKFHCCLISDICFDYYYY